MTATATTPAPDTLDASIDNKHSSIKLQSASAMVLQAHCLSVEAQQLVSFEGFERLEPIKTRANNALGEAKKNARTYLNEVLPRMITTITSIEEYFLIQNAVADMLASTQAKEDAKAAIRLLQERTQEFQRQSLGIRNSLQLLRTGFGNDQATFSALTTELNGLLQGDHGVLADINAQLSSIDGKIAGAAVGVALGGLAVVAGGIMFVVGAFTSVVTGGTAVALCVAGGAVIAVGAGAAAGSAIALGGLLNMKSDLIVRQAKLGAEVKLVNGMMDGFATLARSAGQAQDSAQSMANAWTFLGDHLESLYLNLDKGKSDIPMVRKIFLGAAEKSVAPILRDIDIIKGQMTAPKLMQDTGRRVGDMVIQVGEAQQGKLRLAA